ncbi:DUF2946 domain-containing protein [Serratia ficaria]|uniref:Protein of uncharacterized function (DUF2946) n=1 Tax=Serratia ficaria TaxID=61651 RepID=A0A240C123_SERFI|nr:DUF2946 domain-containing protein [Serratia ficaria]REF44713.1 DUF2946 family protein [Serratia ficaria]CAI0814860.1 Protein of uncharacterised function (DUF2946) [Serratia ficaria]CAI0821443.1 Protein of uncharacterised function (DUF2946) [Serratia ficaria]CAI0834002.1 Protein of uncharacterised function (DUF2946) [Serratia ficaria]CAI1672291.1 Protein of uncharacterised function (DUF2946) [Serratia ficaria]
MSLIQTNASRSLAPAWLGIFAILMLFIAPVVSRSLEHARVGSAETTVMADCGMEMPMHHQPVPPQAHAGAGSHTMAMMMDDSACGYCVLLIHAPLLDLSGAPLFWSGSLTSRPPPIYAIFPLFAHVIHTELQPRAPPASFPLI